MIDTDVIGSIIYVWATILGAIVGILLSLYVGLISFKFTESNKYEEIENELKGILLRLEVNIIDKKKFIQYEYVNKRLLNILNDLLITEAKYTIDRITSIDDYINRYDILIDHCKKSTRSDYKLLTIYKPSNLLRYAYVYNDLQKSSRVLSKLVMLNPLLRKMLLLALAAVSSLIISSLLNIFYYFLLSFIFYLFSLFVFSHLLIDALFGNQYVILFSQNEINPINSSKTRYFYKLLEVFVYVGITILLCYLFLIKFNNNGLSYYSGKSKQDESTQAEEIIETPSIDNNTFQSDSKTENSLFNQVYTINPFLHQSNDSILIHSNDTTTVCDSINVGLKHFENDLIKETKGLFDYNISIDSNGFSKPVPEIILEENQKNVDTLNSNRENHD